MKRFLLLLLAVSLVLALTACSAYKSAYAATMLVKSEGKDGCETKFATLKGTLVLKSTVKTAEADGKIHYDAELGEGEVSVYYDVDGTKNLLFTVKGGEDIEGSGGQVKKGDKVTFIIETVDTAKNGDIELDFD